MITFKQFLTETKKNPKVRWTSKDDIILYHGTNSKAIDSIRKQGLSTKYLATGAEKVHRYNYFKHPKLNYMTNRHDTAIQYARHSAVANPGTKPAVAVIRMPKKHFFKTFQRDQYISPGAVVTPRAIKPKHIVRDERYSDDKAAMYKKKAAFKKVQNRPIRKPHPKWGWETDRRDPTDKLRLYGYPYKKNEKI